MSTAEQARRYRAGWDEERRAYRREWQRRYRASLGREVSGLRENHGLTIEAARAALAAKPETCEICDRKARLCYDHDHLTGAFRGWLCYRCNHGLHMLEDAGLLDSATAYLEADRAAV